ncbi:alpha/beta hydrolase [uncultured Cohaesibacter sp.]|uniref:RBBP9/YdeN family alpha/beta hydrolase n=1 Tax=uncultured Cohaesibacter sp. TaxID=1002546 RepID=UPI0029C8B57A|nr:alpha/beta hydrolase [uncultured Cohaesibacter sp.]
MVRQITDPEIIEALERYSEKYAFVLVPGFKNSGPEHWQSFWERDIDIFQRISQRRWDQRDIYLWIDAIGRTVAEEERPAILIGHSLGALASACVIADHEAGVAGAMFVAPAEPIRFEAEGRIPYDHLDAPTVLVASHNDTLISFPRAKFFAEGWGSDFVDLGEAGHINSEAGFGRWPYGLGILLDLVERIEENAPAAAELDA